MGTLTRHSFLAALIALSSGTASAAGTVVRPASTITGDYLIAQSAEYNGDWKTASSLLASIWQRSHDPSTLRQAFLISLGAGDIGEALKLSNDIRQDMPEAAVSTALLAADAMKRNDLAGATKLLATLPDHGISVPLKGILTAWIDAAHGDRAAAMRNLDGLKQFDTYRKLHTAMIDEFMNDRGRADAGYAALKDGSPVPRIVSVIADYYRRTGRPELASGALNLLPASGSIAAISVRNEQGLVRSKPTVAGGAAEGFYNMAELLLEADHPDIGLFYAAIATHLEPAKPDTHLLLGEIEQAEGRHSQAASDFVSVSSKADFGLLARLDAVLAYEQAGHPEKAIATAEDVAKVHPGLAEPLMELGDLYRRHDEDNKAIATYNRALALLKPNDPDLADVIFARAIAYDGLHNDSAAEADLKQAVSLAPDRATILNYLGFFWASRGENLPQAHTMLDHAFALAPTDGAIADSLGWVFYQMGDYNNAVIHLEQAVQLRPGDSEINGHLGDAYWRVGRISDARFQWRHALLNASGPAVDSFKARLHDGLADPEAKPAQPVENHAALDVKPLEQ